MTNGDNDIAHGIKVLVPTGMLGAGIDRATVKYGIARGAHAIALDSGSTDSGPSYLARAVSKMNRDAIKRDLEILIAEASQAKIPILVGTCGTCGADAGVDWTREIAVEVANEVGIRPKIACLYSEQSVSVLKQKLQSGKITPLEPMGTLTTETLDACAHIVALMGPEPYIRALEGGADIILGGRTTDTAVLAAVPLMRGAGVGPAWHAAKVSECGGQCTVNPRMGGVLMTVGTHEFDIEPLDPSNQCTPQSVSTHMLYETNDPYRLTEPGGILDVTAAVYRPFNERITRVSGSSWCSMPYTMKLEGASAGPYQTIMLIGIADPDVLAHLDEFHDRLKVALVTRIHTTLGQEAGDFDVSIRLYGWNAVSGRPMPRNATAPHEVGALLVITAATQELADRMAKSCNPYFFHFPLRPNIELPSYAFPFSPAEIPRGRVYEFRLNHVVHTHDGHELTRLAWFDQWKPSAS